MYANIVTSVHAGGSEDIFPITIGLHQGSALSPYIFSLVINGVMKDIPEDIPCICSFFDCMLLIDETRIGLNRKSEL
jgi:hypothetical protein